MLGTNHIFPDDAFISIVITSYCRPHYLKRCIDSINEFADMPYEIIVHDDGSWQPYKDEIYNSLKDRVSTLIMNTGWNMGLNIAANRSCAIAQSKYILFMNDDCYLLRPCFKEIASVLDHSYVGFVCPVNEGTTHGEKKTKEYKNAKFHLSRDFGGGHSIAFRKSVWEEVGGWCEWNTTGQSDNVFLSRMIKAGYFKALIDGHPSIESTHPNAEGYVDSISFTKGNDCSYPRLFGLTDRQQIYMNHKRREWCQWWVDGERWIKERYDDPPFDNRENPIAGLNDLPYWGEYLSKIVKPDGTVDWKEAELHNQTKWREEVDRDFS